MILAELQEYLDLEPESGLDYYENFADLIEIEEEISFDLFFYVLKLTELKALGEYIETYLEEILEHLPDDAIELCTLLETLKLSLTGLLEASYDDDNRFRSFVEELYQFRKWYIFESLVTYKAASSEVEKQGTLMEAMVLIRLEPFENFTHQYDFTQCLNYEIDEYVVSFSFAEETEAESDET